MTSTPFERKFQWGGGSTSLSALRGGEGRGGMYIFWNYTFRVYIWQVIMFKCSID